MEPITDGEFTLSGTTLYILIATICVVVSLVSYNAYSANQRANESQRVAKASQEVLASSTGALIDSLMNKRKDNRAKWQKLEEEQNSLNMNTEIIEEKLAKLSISVIN